MKQQDIDYIISFRKPVKNLDDMNLEYVASYTNLDGGLSSVPSNDVGDITDYSISEDESGNEYAIVHREEGYIDDIFKVLGFKK